MKKISLIIAAAVISMAGAAAGSAAESPTYEANGLPISAVQVAVLGAAYVQQSQVTITAPSPHQVRVLTPRPKLTATAAAPSRNAGRAAN